MAGVKDQIERGFEHLARTIYTHRLKVLVFFCVLLGVFFYRIPSITVDTSAEALLDEHDKSRIEYDRFRDQFGQDRFVVITITSDQIFTQSFFERLHTFQTELREQVPYAKDIQSLINARHTWGDNDELIVEDLLEGWPDRIVDFEALKNQVMANPAYLHQFISTDGRTTSVIIEPDVYHTEQMDVLEAFDSFDEEIFVGEEETRQKRYLSDMENEALVEAVREIVAAHHAPDFSLALVGGPVVLEVFNDYTMLDLKKCFLLSFVVILVFLWLLFRRVSGVVLPSIVVQGATFSTLGLLGWSGVPIKMTTTVLPAFLLCVGVADSVHILALFYKEVDRGVSRKDAIGHAVGHSGLAVVLTSLTTAAALLSFSFAELTALGDLGLFAAAGVLLALFYTLFMLPSLVAVVPVRPRSAGRQEQGRPLVMDRILLRTANISIRHPLKIIGISLVLFAVSFYYVFDLRYSDYVVGFFPESMAVRKDIATIDKQLNGSLQLEVIIDTGRENGVYEPRFLNRIDNAAHYLSQYETPEIFVGKIYSLNDLLKEIHQALNENRPEFYAISQDYNTIAQELLLFENAGSDDLEPIVDSLFSKTRVSIKTNWVDSVVLNDFMQETKHYFTTLFGDSARITITGMTALMARTISAALNSMVKSYGLAFVVIAIMMMMLVWDIKTGLFSMIPNIFPIFLSLGIMGFFDVPLDMTSLMIASIAMGLVVDDTVHFVYNFRKYYLRTGDAHEAIRATFLGVGRAMLITSVVLACGFFVLMAATLNHIVRFGFFTGLTILFALLADFLLAPALMIVITGAHKNNPSAATMDSR
ncbi:MAG: MMPL family transporter [Thermodesulfobacteriota bacterium]|nr:MMPL family transporter [Thermodesulfobacteriota bacterium]